MANKLCIAVLGGGNNGPTMAADFALQGASVRLFDLPAFAERIEAYRETKTIEKYGSAETTGRTGFARLECVTTDLAEAIDDADLIVLAVPAYAHDAFFDLLAGHVKPGQTVLVAPGNWGALRLHNLLRARGQRDGIRIAETDICTHICRTAEYFLGPGRVRVVLERSRIRIAAIPHADTTAVHAMLLPFYPQLVAAENVIETSLRNDNTVIHGPLMLMNAGWLEHTAGQFMIYRDGVTPSIARAMDTVRGERERLIGAFGFATVQQPAAGETYRRYTEAQWVKDPCETGPSSLHNRYLSEDVPYGLVALRELALLHGQTMKATEAIITLAGIANEVDYYSEGLTLRRLGFEGMTPEQILKFAVSGTKK